MGILTDIVIDDKTTRYSVKQMRKIKGRHSPQELLLKNTGKPIAPNFIKPYAICRTPSFLAEAALTSRRALASTAMKEQASADQEWKRLAGDLALCLADFSEDEYLVLSSKRVNYYIQVAAQGQFGMRAEATSNAYVEPEEALSTDAHVAMGQLGWKFPTAVPNSGPDPDGSPNFFVDLSSPVDFGSLAELAVHTFRRVYDIHHPGQLQYNSFSRTGTQIRFPTLRLKRKE